LADVRRKRGWTQKRLAQKTGINQSEISTLESGFSNPTYKTLQAIAAALGGKIDLVIG
jgi:transcriptional regulator with XRE-family HTH domain